MQLTAPEIEHRWMQSPERRRLEAFDDITDPAEAHDLARAVIEVYESMVEANRSPTYDTFRLVAEGDEDELFEEEIVDMLPQWVADIVQGYPEDEVSPLAEFFVRILVVEVVALRTKMKATLLLEAALRAQVARDGAPQGATPDPAPIPPSDPAAEGSRSNPGLIRQDPEQEPPTDG